LDNVCYIYDDPTYIDGQNDTGVETYYVPESQSYRGHYGQHAMGLTCAKCNIWYHAQYERTIWELGNKFDAIRLMRENIAKETYQTGFGQLRMFANYFAPDRWTMYDNVSGTQEALWENRYTDGELWSAFKARDILRAF